MNAADKVFLEAIQFRTQQFNAETIEPYRVTWKLNEDGLPLLTFVPYGSAKKIKAEIMTIADLIPTKEWQENRDAAYESVFDRKRNYKLDLELTVKFNKRWLKIMREALSGANLINTIQHTFNTGNDEPCIPMQMILKTIVRGYKTN